VEYQVPWTEFRSALRVHYIPADLMRRKCQEFIDLKQGRRSVHDYSKLFNHLPQYAPDQVDTDEKKKDRFMIGLSTKLQERMVLNTGGTFPEFVSNVIIVDNAICAHKETKKRKVVATLSRSAPPPAPEIPDGVPPRLHLPTPPAAAALALAAAVGSLPTSVPTPAGST
jgi:hypothetical protein